MDENVKQDINFLEYPIWMQSHRKPNKTLTMWEDRDGYTFEASRGVPGKVDMLFMYYFLLECQNQNWADKLCLSRYKILKECGMNIGNTEKKRLIASLEAWKRVTVSFSGTFYTGVSYDYMEFGIVDDWCIREEDNRLEIRLNQKWIEKIKGSEFFKYVSFTQMRSLRSPLALRLYELLVKTFYQRSKWEIDVLKLAGKIPMSERYFSDIVPKIEAATKRIRENTDLRIFVETVKTTRGEGKFIFTKGVGNGSDKQPIE